MNMGSPIMDIGVLQGTFQVAASQPVMYAVEETSNLFHIDNKVSLVIAACIVFACSGHMLSLIWPALACSVYFQNVYRWMPCQAGASLPTGLPLTAAELAA